MKRSRITGGLAVVILMMLSVSAFAGDRGSMELVGAAHLNGKELPAGSYDLKWSGSGSEVQVKFLRGRKTIATAPAKIVKVKDAAERDAAVIDTANGTRELSEAMFAGRNYRLEFTGAP